MWGSNFKKNGGGGGNVSGLNIAYGNTPPSENDKLWVMSNEPSHIDMTNNISVALATDIEEYDSSLNDGKYYNAMAYYDGYLYIFVRPAQNTLWSTGGLIKYNIATKEKQLFTGLGLSYTNNLYESYFSMSVDRVNKKLYITQSKDTINGVEFDLVNNTFINMDVRGGRRWLGQAVYCNGSLYVGNFGGSSYHYTQLYNFCRYDIATGATTVLFGWSNQYNFTCILSQTSIDGKIYGISNCQGIVEGINRYDVFYFDSESNTFINTGINVGKFYAKLDYIEGGKLVGYSSSNKEIIIIDLLNETYQIKTITNGNSFNQYNLTASDNFIFIMSASQSLFRYGYSLDLEEASMSISYECYPNRWSAVDNGDLVIKLNPRAVYIGDNNNKAVRQNALLYNEQTEQWEVI